MGLNVNETISLTDGGVKTGTAEISYKQYQ